MLISPLYAQCAADAGQAGGSGLASMMPLLVIVVIFYVLVFMPERKRAKEHQKMLAALKRDDKVILSSGIHGVVANVKDAVVELRIAENVKITVLRSAVAQVVKDGQQKDGSADPKVPGVVK